MIMHYSEQEQAVINEVTESFEAVMIPARLGHDVPQDAIARLLRALDWFGREWAGKRDIPKAVAVWIADARLLRGWAEKYPDEARRNLQAGASALSEAISRSINRASESPPAG
jgi:hypothetical protein